MTHTPARNPYAAVWEQAEADLRKVIATIHELGVQTDASRRNLRWQGASEQRFQERARMRHDELHSDNNELRSLVWAFRAAAESSAAAQHAAAGATAHTHGATA